MIGPFITKEDLEKVWNEHNREREEDRNLIATLAEKLGYEYCEELCTTKPAHWKKIKKG